GRNRLGVRRGPARVLRRQGGGRRARPLRRVRGDRGRARGRGGARRRARVAAADRRGERVRAIAALALLAALALPSAQAAGGVPSFAHVVVIVFENKEEQQVIGTRDAPTFTRLARSYARLRNYHGVAHPSLPNYLALVSGATHGIRTDCTSCSVSARNLADTLEQAGHTWKTYAEGLPRPGFTGAVAGRYAKKHDPFLYFRDIAGSASRRQNVVPFPQLAADLHAQ